MLPKSPNTLMHRTVQRCGVALLVLIVSWAWGSRAMALQLSLARDDEWDSFVASYVMPLVETAGFSSKEMTFYLVIDDKPNAFVIQGQRVFVHTGLIRTLETADQLLAVLAHELAHIAGGDVLRTRIDQQQQLQQVTVSTLAGLAGALLLGAFSPVVLGLGLGLTSSQADALYGMRVREASADNQAVEFLRRVDVPPESMVEALRVLARLEPIEQGNSYFSTHPITAQRIQLIKDSLNNHDPSIHGSAIRRDPGFPDRFDGNRILDPEEMERRFQRLRVSVQVFRSSDNELRRRYRIADPSSSARKDDPLFVYGQALTSLKLLYLSGARRALDHLDQEWPDDPELRTMRGLIMVEDGSFEGAIEEFREVLRRFPQRINTRYYLADALFRLKQPESDPEAIDQYWLLLERAPTMIVGWDRLASLARRTEREALFDLARAHRHFYAGKKELARRKALQVLEQTHTDLEGQRAHDLLDRLSV